MNGTNQQYHVLAILTTGNLNEIRETINMTVRSSLHPLSIIIVVLDRANYELIKSLESSPENPLYSADLNDFADNV